MKILSFEDKELDFEIIGINKEKDLAVIEIKMDLPDIESLSLQPTASILSEIITIGYPSIPQTKEAYQVYIIREKLIHLWKIIKEIIFF